MDWSLFGKYRFAPNGRFKCEQLNAVWSDCHIDVVDQSERIKDRLDVVIFEHAGAVDGLHDTAFPEQVVRDSKTVAIGRKQYTADCRFDRSEEPPATRCIIDLDRHIAVAGMGVGRASFQRLQMLTFLGAAWAMTQAKVPR